MFSRGGKTNDRPGRFRRKAAAPTDVTPSGDAEDDGAPRRSRRRVRLLLIVVVLVGVCVAVPVGLAGQWFVKGTLDAGKGSTCPACAVDDYFGYGPLATLGGDDLKFERTLCGRNRSRLHEQATQFAKTYLEAARRWNVSPILSHGAMDGDEPENIHDGKASITVDVIHSHDGPGGNVVSRKQVAWHFEVDGR